MEQLFGRAVTWLVGGDSRFGSVTRSLVVGDSSVRVGALTLLEHLRHSCSRRAARNWAVHEIRQEGSMNEDQRRIDQDERVVGSALAPEQPAACDRYAEEGNPPLLLGGIRVKFLGYYLPAVPDPDEASRMVGG